MSHIAIFNFRVVRKQILLPLDRARLAVSSCFSFYWTYNLIYVLGNNSQNVKLFNLTELLITTTLIIDNVCLYKYDKYGFPLPQPFEKAS